MDKGKLTYVRGNVCEPQRIYDNEIAIIPHCCNNGRGDGVGVMGAGVALALRKKWNQVYEIYKRMEKEFPNGLKNRLGENCYAYAEEDIVVVNMIGQDGVVSTDNPKPVKYWALMKCMEGIRDGLILYIETSPKYNGKKPVIHTCQFGCGLAQGNWDFILELIREQWLSHGIDVVIYKFETDQTLWGPIKKIKTHFETLNDFDSMFD